MAVEEVKRIQFPRESTAKNDKYVGVPGEITVDSSRQELRLHNGKTAGGMRIPNLTQLKNLFVSTASDVAKIAFNPTARGILARLGNGNYALRQLIAGDGIAITDGNGVSGNPTIAVDERLASVQTTQGSNYNSMGVTGFFVMAPTAVNRPSGLGDEIGSLIVHRHVTENDDIYVLQRVTSMSSTFSVEYKRWQIAGSWSLWVSNT